jgi:hypothetical protein
LTGILKSNISSNKDFAMTKREFFENEVVKIREKDED